MFLEQNLCANMAFSKNQAKLKTAAAQDEKCAHDSTQVKMDRFPMKGPMYTRFR